MLKVSEAFKVLASHKARIEFTFNESNGQVGVRTIVTDNGRVYEWARGFPSEPLDAMVNGLLIEEIVAVARMYDRHVNGNGKCDCGH